MLHEICNVRQFSGEPARRWFASESMELMVWLDDSNDLVRWELCYDIGRKNGTYGMRVLSWDQNRGYMHARLDHGEMTGGLLKATPMIVGSGGAVLTSVRRMFAEQCLAMPRDMALLIHGRIEDIEQYDPSQSPEGDNHAAYRSRSGD